MMLAVAQALAHTAVGILSRPDLLEAAWAEFRDGDR